MFGMAGQVVDSWGICVFCQFFCTLLFPGDLGLWTVVGGADRGGIIVRSERELGSDAVARLSTGALVPALEKVTVIHWGLPKTLQHWVNLFIFMNGVSN